MSLTIQTISATIRNLAVFRTRAWNLTSCAGPADPVRQVRHGASGQRPGLARARGIIRQNKSLPVSLSLSLSLSAYIYIYIFTCMYTYIYIYRERERGREREREREREMYMNQLHTHIGAIRPGTRARASRQVRYVCCDCCCCRFVVVVIVVNCVRCWFTRCVVVLFVESDLPIQ